MWMYRKNGCKGIIRYYCSTCNNDYYVSSVYANENNSRDYMYEAADMLTGKRTVIVTIDYLDLKDKYESDNDYENLGILRLLFKIDDASLLGFQFSKGPNYHKYIDDLYPLKSGASSRCPYCGSSYVQEIAKGYNTKSFVKATRNSALDRKSREKVNRYFCEVERNAPLNACPLNQIDSSEYQTFIKYLVNIESNIYYCRERLFDLYNDISVPVEQLHYFFIRNKKPKRISVPDAPHEPIYKQPGFFGAAKVIAENERRKQEYEKEIVPFVLERQRFDRELNEFNKNKESYFEEADAAIQKAVESGDYSLFGVKGKDTSSTEYKYLLQCQTVFGEIEDCKEHLEKLYALRAQLHAMNVVYPKYLELPALTTLLEYLESGRCSELTGANGAYNLYESELRMNLVINKLDNIVENLEEIKFNQHRTYMVMKSMSERLDSMNRSVSKLLVTADEISRSAAQAAYNTEKAAQYSHMAAVEAETSNYLKLFYGK